MSTAYAFDPVRRPGPIAPVGPAAPERQTDPSSLVAPTALPRVAPVARPKVLAAAAVLGGVACVVAAQLLLSIGTAHGAYRLAALEQRSDVLAQQQQVQSEVLQKLAAPQHLAAQAAALGMVPDDSPAYLDATTGKVYGSATAASGTAVQVGGIGG